MVAEAGHGLVDAVVQNLIDKMMKSVYPGGSYVHSGTKTHMLKSLEHLDLAAVIFLGTAHNAFGIPDVIIVHFSLIHRFSLYS